MKSRLAAASLLLGMLSGCGPMYETDYAFRAPKNSEGRACVFQCENSRQQCRQIEELRADRCEDHSRQEEYWCEERIRREHGRSPKWYECGGTSCSSDYERCEQSYRYCYQSCGGDVETVTRCVANCDQIPR